MPPTNLLETFVFVTLLFGLKSFAEKNTQVDLNDEKDDGTALVLKDSESIIVPPEEDEDQTDDHATDSDKPEDLEDLKHLGTIHINRNASDFYYLDELEEYPGFPFFSDALKNQSLYLDKDYYHERNKDDNNKTNDTQHLRRLRKLPFKPNSFVRDTPHDQDYSDYYDDNSRLSELNSNDHQDLSDTTEGARDDWRSHYMREKPADKWQKRNQILLFLIVLLTALIILSTIVCTVLLIKLKLNHLRQNKRRFTDNLMRYDEEEDT